MHQAIDIADIYPREEENVSDNAFRDRHRLVVLLVVTTPSRRWK